MLLRDQVCQYSFARILIFIYFLVSPPLALSAEEENEDDLFNLSLNELGKIDVSGKAIRDLGLGEASTSENAFEQALIELPLSIEVMTSDSLRARGTRNVVEAAENLLGVLSGESPSEPYSFSMRGFTRDSVRVMFDGISMGIATLNMRPQSADVLQRIELVKGAASLHGVEGGAGGTLNFITHKASMTAQPHAEALLATGDYGAWRASFSQAAHDNGQFAYRVSGNHNRLQGWVDDSDSQSSNLIADFLWQVNPDLDLRLSLNHLDDELPAYWGTPLLPADVARDPSSEPAHTVDGRVIDEAIRFRNFNVTDDEISSKSNWLTLRADMQLSRQWQSRTTIYSYKADRLWRNAESYNYDALTMQIGRDRLLVKHDRNLHGLQSQFVFDGDAAGAAHQFAIGVELSRNELNRQVGFDIDNPNPYVDYVDVFAPVSGSFGDVDQRQDFTDLNINALVLDYTVPLGDDWRFSLSARHDQLHFNRERYNFSGVFQPIRSLDKTFTLNAWRAGISWQPQRSSTVYLHRSEQHDPIEGELSYLSNLSSLTPPSVEQWEMGWKSQLFDDRVALTLVGFDIKKRAYTAVLDAHAQDNIHRSQGLEFAVSVNTGGDWRTGINATKLHTRYDHYHDFEYDNEVSGNTPVNVPDSMFNWWFSRNNIAGLPLELGLGWNHVGNRYADALNTIRLNAYDTVNLFLAYTQTQYRIALHMRNVTDQFYSQWSDTVYPNQISLGAPRTTELSVQWRF